MTKECRRPKAFTAGTPGAGAGQALAAISDHTDDACGLHTNTPYSLCTAIRCITPSTALHGGHRKTRYTHCASLGGLEACAPLPNSASTQDTPTTVLWTAPPTAPKRLKQMSLQLGKHLRT